MSGVEFPPDPSTQKDMSSSSSALNRTARVEDRLKHLAEHLPEKLGFPFSGRVAFEVGDGPIVEAAHFPEQTDCPPACPFNILSVGKLFTSVSLMQLIEAGTSIGEEKLTLETPLDKLLSLKEMDLELDKPYSEDKPTPSDIEKLQANAHRITVADLLSHRSGLIAEGGPSEKFYEELPEDITHPYSNYGFQLLARIIGKHSPDGNKSNHEAGFRNHIEKRIFEPAHMHGAINEIHYPYQGAKPDQFEVKQNGSRVRDESTEPYPHGNGCWRMHTKDLLCFGQALRHNSFFTKEETFKSMLKRDPPLGFMVDRDKDKNVVGYGHPGSGPGQSSFLHTWLTDPPITATILSNYSNDSNVKPFLDPIIPSLME